jgi:hypothetical protein
MIVTYVQSCEKETETIVFATSSYPKIYIFFSRKTYLFINKINYIHSWKYMPKKEMINMVLRLQIGFKNTY